MNRSLCTKDKEFCIGHIKLVPSFFLVIVHLILVPMPTPEGWMYPPLLRVQNTTLSL